MLQIFLSHLIWSPPMMPPSTSAWYYATQHQLTAMASQEDHPGFSGHNQEQTFSEVNPCPFNKSWTYCVKVFAVSVFVVKIWWWDKMYLSSVGWFSGSPARHSWHFWNGGALSRELHILSILGFFCRRLAEPDNEQLSEGLGRMLYSLKSVIWESITWKERILYILADLSR